MATVSIRLLNASRKPLQDDVDVIVTAMRTDNEVARRKTHDARKTLRVSGLSPNEPYLVRAFPVRHRPVGQFVVAPAGDKAAEVELYCPVDPQRVTPRFPDYADLDPALQRVLEKSTLERDPDLRARPAAGSSGQSLYEGLKPIERAGLLNLFCKMSHVPLGDTNTWSFVKDVYRMRGDRIFVNVALELRDRVKNAVAGGGFTPVDSSLHAPPPDWAHAGSFKTRDRYGNLQLTFFGTTTAPLAFKVDADIDDAAGIEHAFQVIDHALTHGATHPFDIHQILTFFQRLDTGYAVVV
jgi:hypothetical protein